MQYHKFNQNAKRTRTMFEGRAPQPEEPTESKRMRLEAIRAYDQSVDEAVGRILAALKKKRVFLFIN